MTQWFSAVPIRLPVAFFHRNRKGNSKHSIESQKTWVAKTIFRKKNKAGGNTGLDFKLCYKAIVIKTVWYWDGNRPLNRRNRIDSPGVDPGTRGQLNFWQEYTQGKGQSLQEVVLGKLDSHMRKHDIRPLPYTTHAHTHTHIYSKWTKGHKHKTWNCKTLEETK